MTSRLLSVEAAILLTNIGLSKSEINNALASYNPTIPLDIFKNIYTKAFISAPWTNQLFAKRQYINMTNVECDKHLFKNVRKK